MDKAVKSRIIRACRSGQVQDVLTILRSLEGEPGYAEYREVAMFEDCRVGDGAIVKYLVHGAGKHIVNCTNESRETPLHVACAHLNVQAAAEILSVDIGCDINMQNTTGDTPLHLAVKAVSDIFQYEVKIIRLLLSSPDCDPNIRNSAGDTPFMVACKPVNHEVFSALISSNKCDPNIQDNDGNTALHFDALRCSQRTTRTLVSFERYTPDITNNLGETPLHIACSKLNVRTVTVLLKKGMCDVNAQTNTGQTPLHLVLTANAKMSVGSISQLLLQVPSCDPHIANAEGVTPLQIAYQKNTVAFTRILGKGCEEGYPKTNIMIEEAMALTNSDLLHLVIRMGEMSLLKHILKLQTHQDIVNKVEASSGDTPLIIATEGARVEAVELLLDSRYCDPNVRSASNGDTPLIVACKVLTYCTSSYLCVLLCSKCDPRIQNNDGNTVLHFAAASTCQETVKALVYNERYVPNVANKFGENPLHIACNKLRTEAVIALLEAGNCDVNLQTSTGQTALHMVVRAQDNQLDSKVEIVQLLLAIPDCDPNIKCSQGDTPLFTACRLDNQNIDPIISALTSSDKFDPNIQDSDGNTALHLATIKGCHEGVKDLVHCLSYKPDHPNKLCETSLHIACSQLNSQIVTVLLKEGRCDVNAQTNTGQTPLHLTLAAKTSKRDVKKSIIGLILENSDCYPLAVDTNGLTSLKVAYKSDTEAFLLILERACKKGYHKLKEIMEQAMVLTDHNLLHVVSRKSATVVLRTILKVEPSSAIVNKVEDFSGDTPLIVAIRAQCVEAVELLLDSQYCDPNARNALNGNTPLIVACKNAAIRRTKGYAQIIRMILSNDKCDVNGHNDEGLTALHIATAGRYQAAVNALVHHERYKPDIADNQGRTPLHYACNTLDVTTIMAILQQGKCNVNLQTSNGQTPLHAVLVAQDTKLRSKLVVINLLLSHPDCETNEMNIQDTSLNNQQCDPNVFGDTPLHIAVEDSSCDILEALLSSKQTDPNVQNHSGETPLHIACRLSKYDYVVAITKRKQCDVNVREIHGQTALHKAIYNMQPDDMSIIEHLISDSRCDLAAWDLQGNTALHIACRKAAWKHDESIMTLIRRLLSTGKVSPQCVNNAGETPAQLAISNKKVYQELSHFSESQLKHPIETFVKVFVVGNAETGKSTMIKAICTEAPKGRKFVPSQFKTVKGVKPHTAGIVPIPVQSRHFGNAIIYDFAGQHEYYSSHAAVLENLVLSSPPVFVVLVDLSKPFEQMSEVLAYWWSFIGSYTARSHLGTRPHVIVAGSHKDIVKANGGKVSVLATKLLGTLDGLPTNFIHAGFAALNCTLVASDGLTALLSLLKKSYAAMSCLCSCRTSFQTLLPALWLMS